MPFRINITTECVASMDTLRAQAEANAHYPRAVPSIPHGRKLAVVGGGPLVEGDLDELLAWDGDIWGINYTAQWLNERGVKATLYSVDPMPMSVTAPDALLGTCCHPDVVKSFEGRVRVFDLCETHIDGIPGGVVSATRAPSISYRLGYLDVSFFGCEGSFDVRHEHDHFYSTRDHVDRCEANPAQLMIKAGDEVYCTTPGFFVQCHELSTLCMAFPDVYKCRSGGLVRAMIEHPDTWEVVAVSEALKLHLEAVNGNTGLYNEPYVRA